VCRGNEITPASKTLPQGRSLSKQRDVPDALTDTNEVFRKPMQKGVNLWLNKLSHQTAIPLSTCS